MNNVFIALGSNMGNRNMFISKGLLMISNINEINIINKSNIYETKPMYNENQSNFLNMVILLETTITPIDLLRIFKYIEKEIGRTKNNKKNHPRVIDIDILDYNKLIINSQDLNLPHPRIKERMFVLKPWTDISPDFKLPTERITISKMMSLIKTDEEVVKLYKV